MAIYNGMKRNFWVLAVVVSQFGCAPKIQVTGTCPSRLLPEEEWIESKIQSSKKTKTVASQVVLSGDVLGALRKNDSIELNPLYFTQIRLVNFTTSDTILTMSDVYGKYSVLMEPGSYSIKFWTTGFNNLIVKSSPLHKGDSITMNIILGQGFGESYQKLR